MCGETSTLVSGGARLPLDEKGWRSEHHPDGEQDTVKLEQCAAVVTVAVSYGRRKGDDTDRDESLRVVRESRSCPHPEQVPARGRLRGLGCCWPPAADGLRRAAASGHGLAVPGLPGLWR